MTCVVGRDSAQEYLSIAQLAFCHLEWVPTEDFEVGQCRRETKWLKQINVHIQMDESL